MFFILTGEFSSEVFTFLSTIGASEGETGSVFKEIGYQVLSTSKPTKEKNNNTEDIWSATTGDCLVVL